MVPVHIADYSFRPIVQWPGKLSVGRRSAPFRSTYNQTLTLLERELRELNGRNVVFQIALPAHQFRKDGLPYADAKPSHPGIILTFNGKHGPIQMPCDAFGEWTDNLRAIALALEALRKVDRYGVTKLGQQYTGWKQLPPPLVTTAPMTVEQAAAWLAKSYAPMLMTTS